MPLPHKNVPIKQKKGGGNNVSPVKWITHTNIFSYKKINK